MKNQKRFRQRKLFDEDYVLVDRGCWITVKKFSIRIVKTDEGVVVDIYPLGHEDEGILAGTYAYDDEYDFGGEEKCSTET